MFKTRMLKLHSWYRRASLKRKELNCVIPRRRAQLVSEELVDGLLEDKHPEPLPWFAPTFH